MGMECKHSSRGGTGNRIENHWCKWAPVTHHNIYSFPWVYKGTLSLSQNQRASQKHPEALRLDLRELRHLMWPVRDWKMLLVFRPPWEPADISKFTVARLHGRRPLEERSASSSSLKVLTGCIVFILSTLNITDPLGCYKVNAAWDWMKRIFSGLSIYLQASQSTTGQFEIRTQYEGEKQPPFETAFQMFSFILSSSCSADSHSLTLSSTTCISAQAQTALCINPHLTLMTCTSNIKSGSALH